MDIRYVINMEGHKYHIYQHSCDWQVFSIFPLRKLMVILHLTPFIKHVWTLSIIKIWTPRCIHRRGWKPQVSELQMFWDLYLQIKWGIHEINRALDWNVNVNSYIFFISIDVWPLGGIHHSMVDTRVQWIFPNAWLTLGSI